MVPAGPRVGSQEEAAAAASSCEPTAGPGWDHSAISRSNPARNSALEMGPLPSVSIFLNSAEMVSCSICVPSMWSMNSAGVTSPLLSASMASKI